MHHLMCISSCIVHERVHNVPKRYQKREKEGFAEMGRQGRYKFFWEEYLPLSQPSIKIVRTPPLY